MPIGIDSAGRFGVDEQPPELSTEDVQQARSAFVAAVERELRLAGEHTEDTTKVLVEIRDGDRLEVTSKFGGPEVRFYMPTTGGRIGVIDTVRYVVETATTRAKLAAFGADPETLLVERLVTLGIPRAEAQPSARRRVHRNPETGAVEARGIYQPLAPSEGATAEQLAAWREDTAKKAITAAARLIVAERERAARTPQPTGEPVDRGAELRRAIGGYL